VKNEIIGHGAWIVVETLPIIFVAREGCCRFNNSWPPMDHVKSYSPTGASPPAAYLAQVEYQLNGWRDAELGRSGIGSLPIANWAGPTQATVVPGGAESRLAWRASPDPCLLLRPGSARNWLAKQFVVFAIETRQLHLLHRIIVGWTGIDHDTWQQQP
jgi:hypothetical protein